MEASLEVLQSGSFWHEGSLWYFSGKRCLNGKGTNEKGEKAVRRRFGPFESFSTMWEWVLEYSRSGKTGKKSLSEEKRTQ